MKEKEINEPNSTDMNRKGIVTAFLLAAGLLAGCSSHPEIPVSDQQALVMESSVLAAGISASEPAVVATEIQATASSTLYNERQQPVTDLLADLGAHALLTALTQLEAGCIRWTRRAPSWFRHALR